MESEPSPCGRYNKSDGEREDDKENFDVNTLASFSLEIRDGRKGAERVEGGAEDDDDI